MTDFIVLRAEREFDKKRNGEERLVQSCVEMLDNSGFQVAVSHVERGVRWNSRPLREMLFRGPPILGPKRLLSNRLLGRKSQEAAGEAG